jgi:subtilisin family serine protease
MSSSRRPGNDEDDKAASQIGLVLKTFAEAKINIGAWPNDQELGYLYEREVILIRDAYRAEVEALVGGQVRDGLIDGVTAWSIPREEEESRRPSSDEIDEDWPYAGPEVRTEVTNALDRIDSQLGVGVAGPNHVLSICPGYMCPATEPEPVPAVTAPDPALCRDCDGDATSLYVIDTGLLDDAHTHPWLSGVTGQFDSFTDPIPPYTGHGTFVAGVARCMAPRSQVYVARVLHYAGAQLESEIVKRLDLAMGAGPDIISLSAGGWSRKNVPPVGFVALWQRYRHHKGVQLVAAAGNNSSRRPFWPAAFPEVVSVGALSASWRSRATFSDYGGWVDVYAPGEGLINAYATGTYDYKEPANAGRSASFHGMARWSGTSFATPLVSGLIAARMSRTGENSRRAARQLLALSRGQAIPGVGPVLYPCENGEGGDICSACCPRGTHDGCRHHCCHRDHH